MGSNKTWFKNGPSPNPGGLTRESRAVRDIIQLVLQGPEYLAAFRIGYLNQLKLENPIMLKDYADRMGGKPIERVEVVDGPDGPERQRLTLDELKSIARFQLEKEKTLMLERAHDNDSNGNH